MTEICRKAKFAAKIDAADAKLNHAKYEERPISICPNEKRGVAKEVSSSSRRRKSTRKKSGFARIQSLFC